MSQYSLDVLRQRYVVEKRPLETRIEQILRADTRAGARAILASIDKRRFGNRSEGQRLRKMLRFETSLWESGLHAVAGVDEAGMSPLAGPVSAGAVILKPGTRIIGIDDSKKLDAAAREELAKEIKEKAESWCVVFVEEIDAINIYWAGILAMQRAVRGLGLTPQHLLIDAKRLKEINIPQQAIIKGDAKSASIAAASISSATKSCGRSTCVIPSTDSRITRATRCRRIMRRSPGLAHAQLTGDHSAPFVRLSGCRPCRPGLRRPNGPSADSRSYGWSRRHYFRDQFFSRTTSLAFLSERRPR
jgi:ribonuclease HII